VFDGSRASSYSAKYHERETPPSSRRISSALIGRSTDPLERRMERYGAAVGRFNLSRVGDPWR
jgi:hypothetical protein